jgi:hypothetical protein
MTKSKQIGAHEPTTGSTGNAREAYRYYLSPVFPRSPRLVLRQCLWVRFSLSDFDAKSSIRNLSPNREGMRLKRQMNGEGGARHVALERDPAAVPLDNLFDERQAQSGADHA